MTLDYLASIEHDPYLGILEPINLNRKPPIYLRHMRRVHLARLFERLGYKKGAEIGVAKGRHAKLLALANPEATIYCIDPWRVYDGYDEPYTPAMMEEIYTGARNRLRNTRCVIMRQSSMEAVKDFEDESLDFAYIDGNHEFQHVTNDIAEWSKKVREGGIIAGHDFTRYRRNPKTCHVKSVVGAWAYAHKIKPWFVASGDHGSTWFWVKDAY